MSMKIALINKAFSLRHGGGERYAVTLARALCKKGQEVHLFGGRIEDVPSDAICHPVALPQGLGFWKVLAFPFLVRPLVEAEYFDIIYGLTQYYPVDLFRMGGGFINTGWLYVSPAS